jgi:hypothetical protein
MDVRQHDGGRDVVVGSRSDFLDRSVVDPPAYGAVGDVVSPAGLSRVNRRRMANLEADSRSTAQGRSASRTEREAALMPGGRDPNAPPINPILRWLLIVTMLMIGWSVFGPRLLDYFGL